MRPISTLSLSLTFAGCFLGAGYVSGQEIWQFFGSFGIRGVLGLLMAVTLQCIFGTLLLTLARRTGLSELDKIVIRPERPGLRALVGFLEIFFIFGVCVIMYAGAGALLLQMTGLPYELGSALLCLLVAAVSLRGFSGMVGVFSLCVPFLVVLTVIFSGLTVGKFGFTGFVAAGNTVNPLLGSWGFSAITFVSSNLFSSIAILAPIAGHVRDGKTLRRGMALGSFILFAIAFAIILAMSAYPGCIDEQLPMLELAFVLSPAAGWVFSALLLMGMYGSALSCHVAAVEYFGMKSRKMAENKILLTFALVALGWVCSLWGFSDLVGTIYPLCGYCGFGALVGMAEHYIYISRRGGK